MSKSLWSSISTSASNISCVNSSYSDASSLGGANSSSSIDSSYIDAPSIISQSSSFGKDSDDEGALTADESSSEIGDSSSNRLNEYIIGAQLGKGHFSQVFEGYNIGDRNRAFALKVLCKSGSNVQVLWREISVHRMLHHPNIIRLEDFFETPTKVYIVLEMAPRVLKNELERYHMKRLPEMRAARILEQLVGAVHYCHGKGVVHRDIKASNILLSDEGHVKLADFGLAIRSSQLAGGQVRGRCGTLYYMAPEVMAREPYDEGVDIWSVGIVCYFCIVGTIPFRCFAREKHVRFAVIEKAANNCAYRIPTFVSPPARDLIRKLLQPEPSSRLPLRDILNHDWILASQRFSRRRK